MLSGWPTLARAVPLPAPLPSAAQPPITAAALKKDGEDGVWFARGSAEYLLWLYERHPQEAAALKAADGTILAQDQLVKTASLAQSFDAKAATHFEDVATRCFQREAAGTPWYREPVFLVLLGALAVAVPVVAVELRK